MMEVTPTPIRCDGCGLPASPQHLAERLQRLEWATRFRPIHINVLFAALSPTAPLQDDFYRPPESREFFDALMHSLDILPPAGSSGAEARSTEASLAGLAEFQRRGYYLAYVSECPMTAAAESNAADGREARPEWFSRLAPTFVRRLRHNYKPKHVIVIGAELSPLIGTLEESGMGSLLLWEEGKPLELPSAPEEASGGRLRAAPAAPIPRAQSSGL